MIESNAEGAPMEITESEDRGARISAAAEGFVYGYPLVYSLILRSPDRDPGGKIAHTRDYPTCAEALEAVGLHA